MKILLLIRHAKSSWEIGSLKDFDRPLDDRGNRDAPVMAEKILKKAVAIDCFISSPAIRAKSTAMYFAKAYEKDESDIVFIPKLYEASVNTFYEVVKDIDPACKTAALFSHNPGISEFVNSLGVKRIDDMPTCAIYAITIQSEVWTDFQAAAKDFMFFKHPR